MYEKLEGTKWVSELIEKKTGNTIV